MASTRLIVVKKLLASSSTTSSSSVYQPSNRRCFFTGAIGRVLLNCIPHTLCTTTRVIQEGEGEAGIQVVSLLGKHPKVSLGEGAKFSLCIPGREKTHETPQGLCVFIDLGLDKIADDDLDELDKMADDHLDDQSVKVTKLHKTLFIRGYAQIHGIRKNYNARVTLPTTKNISSKQPIKTEIKDGGLLVTLPKLVHHV